MSISAPLPTYDSLHNDLPAYDPGPLLAPTFKIGSSFTPPFVSISSVRLHLLILGAFKSLRETILEVPIPEAFDPPLRDEVRWSLFLARAVHRFELWVTHVVKVPERTRGEVIALRPDELPPLDVLLVFHAYLLNPYCYYEDCERVCPELAKIGGFPLEQVALLIDPQIFAYKPTLSQIDEWELSTQESFSVSVPSLSDTLDMICPCCGDGNLTIPWVAIPTVDPITSSVEGVGYAQRGFRIPCPTCRMIVTKGAICTSKLAQDIARVVEAHSRGRDACLANTLMDSYTATPSPRVANIFSKYVVHVLRIPEDIVSVNTIRSILGNLFKWNLEDAQRIIEDGFRTIGPRMWQGEMIGRMMRAYRQPTMFSLDLVGAVKRQEKFISQIHRLSWTSPAYVASHIPTICTSITRYHAFLDLLAHDPARMLVPTLSIDLSWHTHLLSGEQYHKDMTRYIGRFVNHDDKVEEGKLASAYEETIKVWKARFKERPCLSDDLAVASSSKLPFWKKHPQGEMHTVCESQPSEHSSILVLNGRRALQAKRKARESAKEKSQVPSTRAFVRDLPEPGATGFEALQMQGWDLDGVRDASVIDGSETRGDCCTGATVSNSTIGYYNRSSGGGDMIGALMRV